MKINKELQAVNGKKLKLNVTKVFTTESSDAVNQRFDQLINDIKSNTITFKEALKLANYNENFLEKVYENLKAPLIPADDTDEARAIRNTVAFQTFMTSIIKKSGIAPAVDSINKARYQEIAEEFIIHKLLEGNPTPYEQALSKDLSNVIASRFTNDFASVGPETDALMEKIFEPFNQLLEQPTNGRELKESPMSVSEFIYELFGKITFADPNLEKAVRDSIVRRHGDIYPEHVASLKVLFANNRRIKDVDGIQFLTSLRHLYIENNQISNVEPIMQLPNLNRLDIYENNLSKETIDYLKANIPWIYVW